MAASRQTHITKKFTCIPLNDIIDDFDNNCIIIPPHQREYCWDHAREEKFIISILKGYPIPSILMSESRDVRYPSIEDGRQRLTAASRFRNNKISIKWAGSELTYDGLSSDDKRNFDSEQFMVQSFKNATADERIQIFDWHQNGCSLTPGERLHAQSASELISFVKALLMTPGSGYHDRAAPIWGVRGDPLEPQVVFISRDTRRKWLLNATALVMGLVYGPKNATKKYQPELGLITAHISPKKKAAAAKDLVRILEIYEAAEQCVHATSKNGSHAKHFDLGTYTGCILYSLSSASRKAYNKSQEDLSEQEKHEFEKHGYAPNSLEDNLDEWETIKATWVDYIVGVRRTINSNPTRTLKKVLEEKIHRGASKARSWTIARWENGYNRVFGFHATDDATASGDEDEDEDDDE